MNTQASSPPPPLTLTGEVERFTYQSPTGDYAVAAVKTTGGTETVVGNLAGLHVGQEALFTGVWLDHPKWGRQFKAAGFQAQIPTTRSGVEKFLGGGLVKGIGPATARALVDHFDVAILDILDAPDAAQQLQTVSGIGPAKATKILAGWQEARALKEIMVFLQSVGLSTTLAVKVQHHLGSLAIPTIQQDPFSLTGIPGIGFTTADLVARNLGIAPDAPTRLLAGLVHQLEQAQTRGHCFLPQPELVQETARLLDVAPALCHTALTQDTRYDSRDRIALDEDAAYPTRLYTEEHRGATRLVNLLYPAAAADLLTGDFADENWPQVFGLLSDGQLSEEQQAAIRMLLTRPVSILTGGPGTGKTRTVRGLVDLLRSYGYTLHLAAPTGRAAKRLHEMTGQPAKTVHRLLNWLPGVGAEYHEGNPLPGHLILVDEASMLDVSLFYRLVCAVQPGTHLVLVGDVDQLPSVGPGNVLHDLLLSAIIPVTRLTQVFRQAQSSGIVVNAHRVRQGQPLLGGYADLALLPESDPARAAERVVELVVRNPQFKPEQVQVLTPLRKGTCGVYELNRRLQAALNPPGPYKPEHPTGLRILRVGDRVMQTQNDYSKDVFNGDQGQIVGLDLEERTLSVAFEGQLFPVVYDLLDAVDALEHAWAITIHKSQGSEFPCVVMPLLQEHCVMLQRNLVYTGITRAQQQLCLVYQPQAVTTALRQTRVTARYTRLARRVQELGV